MFSFDYFPYSETISLQIVTSKAPMSTLEPYAYFMCNKNFADTFMTSYNDVIILQILKKIKLILKSFVEYILSINNFE